MSLSVLDWVRLLKKCLLIFEEVAVAIKILHNTCTYRISRNIQKYLIVNQEFIDVV